MGVIRRHFLKCAGAAVTTANVALSQAVHAGAGSQAIVIDPKPLFEISPHLYMQFMEPLGTTDPSVEAAWDYQIDDWRKDFIDTVADLAPGCIRWGGIYSWYCKWREGIGPPAGRRPARNLVWGGKESNRIGTHEFVNLCRRTGADPLMCVNFLSEGKTGFGGDRAGNAQEAADWVSYANDPDSRERKSDGTSQPYSIKLWQIGNETSYGPDGFAKGESIAHTIEFARAMRRRDRSIELIGWGDRCNRNGKAEWWTTDLVERAGEWLNYVAFHMMGQSPDQPHALIRSWKYQGNPEQAWVELQDVFSKLEPRLREVEQRIQDRGSGLKIAITEGHLGLMHNLSPLLQEWLTGVYHARVMNLYQRHGGMVRISTAADFEGNRWTSNAVMIPGGQSYLMPVGSVMRLFKRVNGTDGVAVTSAPANLDIAASRSGNKIYLHVANTDYRSSVQGTFVVDGMQTAGGKAYEIAPEDARAYVDMDHPRIFVPVEKSLPAGQAISWRFPARSVTAIELDC
jgi:alpha-N-arabinofuranosidase